MRCALTLLAIQEPGISKYCERCGKQYLTEEALLEHHVRPVNPDRTNTEVLTAMESNHNHLHVNEVGERQESLIAQQQVSSPEYEFAPLTRMLFSNYDVCVFCDGKFIG